MRRSLTLICMLALLTVTSYSQTIHLDDNSDWWSINRGEPSRPSAKATNGNLQADNFEIAGITLGRGGSDAITTELGTATSVKRGDASAGRSQLCYRLGHDGTEHLVFEFGEDESVVYIFSGGEPWSGEKFCVSSEKALIGLGTVADAPVYARVGRQEFGGVEVPQTDKLADRRVEETVRALAEIGRITNEPRELRLDRDVA